MKIRYPHISFLLLVIILLIAMQSRAQYVFTPSKTLIKYQNYNDLTYDSIHIANNSADTLFLKWQKIQFDSINGTYVDFCASGECYLGIPVSGSFPPIKPYGSGYAGVHFWTGNVAAVSTARIWVYKEGNIAAGDTLTYILYAEHQTSVKNNTATDDMLRLFPNPAGDRLLITPAFAAAVGIKISIYNTLGEVVFSRTYPDKAIEISLAPYKEGLYFVSLESGKQKYTEKLLIAR